MTPHEALEKLEFLLSHGREIEWIERKEARNNCDFDDLGKYFSALSNEANLYGQPYGWLIFGVADDGAVVGTRYRNDARKLDSFFTVVTGNPWLPSTWMKLNVSAIKHYPGTGPQRFVRMPRRMIWTSMRLKKHGKSSRKSFRSRLLT